MSLTRVLSSRKQVDALAGDTTAKEYIDAISDLNDTLNDLTEDWDAVTIRDILLSAFGSHHATTTQFTFPRLPSTLTEPSPVKQTRLMEWYKTNVQHNQVKTINQRIKSYQGYTDNNHQVSPAMGTRGTSTPLCPASTSSTITNLVNNPSAKQLKFKMPVGDIDAQ